MAKIALKGPAPKVAYQWRGEQYYFVKGIVAEVPDAFRDYLMERSASSLEEAALYGEHVWEIPGRSKSSRGEEAES